MRKVFLILFILSSAILLSANPKKRGVMIDTVCHAPIAQLIQVADSFCYQFQACPDSLFLWAYLNLNDTTPKNAQKKEVQKNKESRDVIQLRYKDRSYNAETKTGDVAIDIYVLGMRWWKDQHLGTIYTKTHPKPLLYPVTAHMTATYSGSILDGGDFIMIMEPLGPSTTLVHYEFNLAFGSVLANFISDKTWHNGIEWRFVTIFENLIECAETGTVKQRPPKYKK